MPALLTASQSRWALQGLVAILSAVAIASSAPDSVGGAQPFQGAQGDIRSICILLGAAGLGGLGLLRGASMILPRAWGLYVDRVEFTFVTMLWVLWISTTMAFSAFTIAQGVCARDMTQIAVPACPLLTFDLAILHLLSTATLCLLLVLLSQIVSPTYLESFSSTFDAEQSEPGKGTGLVLWDMALAPLPSPPMPTRTLRSQRTGYGALVSDDAGASQSQPEPVETDAAGVVTPARKDKFAAGRAWAYIPLLVCSLGVVISAGILLVENQEVGGSVMIIATSILSGIFAATFLGAHFFGPPSQPKSTETDTFWTKHSRSLEVSTSSTLFFLWSLSAVIYTLLPATPNRPCANPAAEAVPPSLDLSGTGGRLCTLSTVATGLAWAAAWIVLGRVVGLVFPMPDVGWKAAAVAAPREPAGLPLLGTPAPEEEEVVEDENGLGLQMEGTSKWSGRRGWREVGAGVAGHGGRKTRREEPDPRSGAGLAQAPEYERLMAGEEFELEDEE